MKLVYKTLKERMREYNRRDAKFYGNMFAKWRKLEQLQKVPGKQEPQPMAIDSAA